MKLTSSQIAWKPQEGPQEAFVSCPLTEVLYGGAAGGGKTDALLGDYSSGIDRYGAGWQGVIFRRTFPQLQEIEQRAMQIWGPIYGVKAYNKANHQWNFPSGAVLKLRFLEKNSDVENYQGHQYSWIGWDELTQWPDDYCYTYMFSRLRSAKGAPCFVRATTNPGGVGHSWVKARFIDPATPMTLIKDDITGENRVFIPAKLSDNKILVSSDPGYELRLDMISDPVTRRALKDGDWNIFAGQAFGEFDPSVHIIPNHELPAGVPVWKACDWGFVKPYCVLWAYANYDGDIVIWNELYGMKDKPNEGSEEPATVVRDKIESVEATNNVWTEISYLDGQCWAKLDDQPSVYDRLGGASMNWQPWPKGPGSRVNQKQIVHDWLKVINGKSRLKIMERCHNLIRTLPAIPLSRHNPEDIDTDSEDHAYDALRGLLAKKVYSKEERLRHTQMRRANRIHRQRHQTKFGGF